MRFGVSDTCLEHDPGVRHPENPDRIRAIREGLKDGDGVAYETPDTASRADALAVHDETYLEEFESFSTNGGGSWDPDTIATAGTWAAALASAGIAEWVAAEAIDASIGHETPFSLGRPPGHHATPGDAMGFCFLNNVAIAVEDVVAETDVERVAIFDWDVHHGNGTQDVFYDRGDVFYASIHEKGLYPGTGAIEETGTGVGEGFTTNVPLPPGSTDREYVLTVDEVIAPAVRGFHPDLVLVSAGFDAHRNDPISRMHLSTEGFGLLTERIVTVAAEIGAGLGFVLEGGYGLEPLADGVRIVNDVLEGRTVHEPEEPVDPDVESVLDEVKHAHAGSWWN